MNLFQVDRLVELSTKPIPDDWLEGLHRQEISSNPNEPRPYYRLLYHLAQQTKSLLCLEIGTEHGIGSAHMAVACDSFGGHVIGVDLEYPANRELADRFDNYTHLIGDSNSFPVREAVTQLVKQFGGIGLAYQDSSHHYEASCQEFEFYSALCVPGAIWVCDDITPAFHDPKIDPPGKGMVQFWEQINQPKKLYPNVLHYGSTMGVVLL